MGKGKKKEVAHLKRWAGRERAIFIAVKLTPDGKNAEMTK